MQAHEAIVRQRDCLKFVQSASQFYFDSGAYKKNIEISSEGWMNWGLKQFFFLLKSNL